MANSDNAYGVFNKQTKIMYQKQHQPDSSWDIISQSFSGNLTTAKDFFLTAEAQALNDSKGTQLSYAITDDGNGLKFTIAFGIPADPSTTPWAKAWSDGKTELIADLGWAGGWVPSNEPDDELDFEYKHVASTDDSDHLF